MHNRRLLTRSFHSWRFGNNYSIIVDTTNTKEDFFHSWRIITSEENIRKEEDCYIKEEFNYLLP